MNTEATPQGASPEPASPQPEAPAPQASSDPLNRIKAVLSGQGKPPEDADLKKKRPPSESAKSTVPEGSTPSEDEGTEEAPAEEEAAAPVKEKVTEAESEEESAPPLRALSELAESLEVDMDTLMDLETDVKIDGKASKAKLRDLLKSYQLEGHLNQKLMAQAEERKAFEAERQKVAAESGQLLQRLTAGQQVLEQALLRDFNGLDWATLQREDPNAYAQTYVAYQQRVGELQQIAETIRQESQKQQAARAAQTQGYIEEQKKLLQSRVPEWSDDSRRSKDFQDIAAYVKDYGIGQEELNNLTDHRLALVLRDAWLWNKLQKSKPGVLNKVKQAPRLIKPGTPQSGAQVAKRNLDAVKSRLKQSGSIHDAAALIRQLGLSKTR
jgi:hypothetical protein